MFNTLLQMFALIGLGLVWTVWNPARLGGDTSRHVLTSTVYYVFLPALVLDVIWQAPLGWDTARIAGSAAAGVLAALALSAWTCRVCRIPRPIAGAVMLAAAFPNATYMGLPLLESTLGPWARSVAIQYDLFACTPLLLTVGILVASRYGSGTAHPNPLLTLVRVPPLWAALAGAFLNVEQVAVPAWFGGLLQTLGAAVVPLMLMAVGMALRQGFTQWRHWPVALPVLAIQLAVMPLLVWGVAVAVGLQGEVRLAVVLEAAMPSMALGVVWCDRYGLNTGVYAAAMTLTTLVSALTLPLWYGWV